MPLTQAQLQTLKSAIAANTTPLPTGDPLAGTLINVVPSTVNGKPNTDGANSIANWYNLPASPSFLVFRSNVPVSDILNQILLANYTPNDAITAGNAAEWNAWAISCQNKQINLQMMLQNAAQSTFNATLINMRKAIKDATSNLPSGAGGALQDGGWGTAPTVSVAGTEIQGPGILSRPASNIEKLFAVQTSGPLAVSTDPLGGLTNNALPVFDSAQSGGVQVQDILNAWAS